MGMGLRSSGRRELGMGYGARRERETEAHPCYYKVDDMDAEMGVSGPTLGCRPLCAFTSVRRSVATWERNMIAVPV